MARGHIKSILWISIVSVVAFLLSGFLRQRIDVTFSDGSFARITPASTWNSFQEGSKSTITYTSKSGQAGTVVLWQDFFHFPITVLPARDPNVLLCLYDFDVDFRLIRINTAKKFKPFLPGSILNSIVCVSPWEVRAGTTNDWEVTMDYLKKIRPSEFKRVSVPSLSFGIMHVHRNRDTLVDRLETGASFISDDNAEK
jgi:hypothetical protein